MGYVRTCPKSDQLGINGNLLAYLQRNQFNLTKFHFKGILLIVLTISNR